MRVAGIAIICSFLLSGCLDTGADLDSIAVPVLGDRAEAIYEWDVQGVSYELRFALAPVQVMAPSGVFVDGIRVEIDQDPVPRPTDGDAWALDRPKPVSYLLDHCLNPLWEATDHGVSPDHAFDVPSFLSLSGMTIPTGFDASNPGSPYFGSGPVLVDYGPFVVTATVVDASDDDGGPASVHQHPAGRFHSPGTWWRYWPDESSPFPTKGFFFGVGVEEEHFARKSVSNEGDPLTFCGSPWPYYPSTGDQQLDVTRRAVAEDPIDGTLPSVISWVEDDPTLLALRALLDEHPDAYISEWRWSPFQEETAWALSYGVPESTETVAVSCRSIAIAWTCLDRPTQTEEPAPAFEDLPQRMASGQTAVDSYREMHSGEICGAQWNLPDATMQLNSCQAIAEFALESEINNGTITRMTGERAAAAVYRG